MTYLYKYSGKKKKLKWEICSSSPSPLHTYRFITAVSNIPVQLFDHILGVQFRAIPVTV
ncbi:hypothetical protein L208DRAFT_1402774 [Tricholoma matsutake]|nr:hypothetical protein L208DRAFT_1402774 [Tricholoma matsutake 945]